MCIISVLPKGTEKNTDKVFNFIKCGYDSNQDGSGFMFKRNGSKKITIDKGYFNLNDFLQKYQNHEFTIDDEVIIHHRTMTHGSIKPQNCHPFVISADKDEVDSIEITTNKPCMAHNGVFRNITPFRNYTDDFTDTHTFARFILSNKHVMKIFKEDKVLFKGLFAEILSTSKLALLYPDRDLEMFGDFIESEGYFHSNSGFKTNVYDKGGSSFGYYGHAACNNGWDDIEDDKDDGVNYEAKPLVNETNKVKNEKFDKILLDRSSITITEKNFQHFIYVRKSEWHAKDDYSSIVLLSLNDYNPDSISSEFQNVTGRWYVFYPTKDLHEHFYYIPRQQYTKIYEDYLDLLSMKDPVGKSTLQKLDRIMSKMNKLTNTDTYFYHKLGKKVCKMSLIMYKKYLESNKIIKVNSETLEEVTC